VVVLLLLLLLFFDNLFFVVFQPPWHSWEPPIQLWIFAQDPCKGFGHRLQDHRLVEVS
jgi:hypothetical protein